MMCKFLSAIVLQNGDVLCDPEHTDAHEELIAANNLRDGTTAALREHFVRVEFVPPETGDMSDMSLWQLKLDENAEPSWWAGQKEKVREFLSGLVSAHVVRDYKKILLGGWWVLADGAVVDRLVASKAALMLGSSNVGVMLESSKVGVMRGSSNVGVMRESSKVGVMWESSKVGVDNRLEKRASPKVKNPPASRKRKVKSPPASRKRRVKK